MKAMEKPGVRRDHLHASRLTTVSPYRCRSLWLMIGSRNVLEGFLDLERIKRVSEMIPLIEFLFPSRSNTV